MSQRKVCVIQMEENQGEKILTEMIRQLKIVTAELGMIQIGKKLDALI